MISWQFTALPIYYEEEEEKVMVEKEKECEREREREVENNSIKVILAANYLFGCSTSLQLYLAR